MLEPATFQCLAIPCPAPNRVYLRYSAGNLFHPVPFTTCVEGALIPYEGYCTPICGIDYRAMTEELPGGKLQCFGGTWTPAWFSCTASCADDSLCSGHGVCVARPGFSLLCQGDNFVEPGVAWNFRSLDFAGLGENVPVAVGHIGDGYLLYTVEDLAVRLVDYPLPGYASSRVVLIVLVSDASGSQR